jgi:general secretion pathway protein M
MTTAARFLSVTAPLRQRWRALPPAQRQTLGLGGFVLALLLAWALAVQPALRTLQRAAVEREALEAQFQAMQRLAEEARELQRMPPVPAEQAVAALQAATDRLGGQAQLMLQGERAVLSVHDVGTTALSDWLLEARSGARALPVEANLARGERGYSGTVVVMLGGGS